MSINSNGFDASLCLFNANTSIVLGMSIDIDWTSVYKVGTHTLGLLCNFQLEAIENVTLCMRLPCLRKPHMQK